MGRFMEALKKAPEKRRPAADAGPAPTVGRPAEAGGFGEGERVVCVLTGHGLKDPVMAIEVSPEVRSLPVRLEAVEEALFG